MTSVGGKFREFFGLDCTPSVHFYKTSKTFQTMYKIVHFKLSEMTYKSERRKYFFFMFDVSLCKC